MAFKLRAVKGVGKIVFARNFRALISIGHNSLLFMINNVKMAAFIREIIDVIQH
jgi:hypothetical protein